MEEKIETQQIEFKSNWRDEYLKAVCAFANSDGGVLLVGVDDMGTPSGFKHTRKLLEDIPNKIRNILGIIGSVEIENKDGHEILRITVERQSVPISYDGKYYIRSGSNTFELKGNELVDFFLKKQGRSWDEIIDERAGIGDLNTDTIEKFKNYARDRIPSISNENDSKVILEKLNLTEDNKLKRAAILLFGKNPQRFFPAAYLKIGKFLSDIDILTSDIIKGNLFEQLDNALEILRGKYLISRIKFEGIHRREILELPYEALREAILNALVHRDYAGSAAIQLRIYDNRILLLNEGKLPPEIPLEKLKTSHLSKPRNPMLADIFYKAGYIESWGRGTLEIISRCLAQHLPEPEFFEEYGVFQVVLYKSKVEIESLEENDKIARVEIEEVTRKEIGEITSEETGIVTMPQIKEDLKEIDITREEIGEGTREETGKITREETDEKIAVLIAENPSITVWEIAQKIGISGKGIDWHIKKMKENGTLKRIGPKKGGYWVMVGKKSEEKGNHPKISSKVK